MDKEQVIAKLNQALENEYAGVVRYSHYSLMISGSIVSHRWLVSFSICRIVGTCRTDLRKDYCTGGHPSLKTGSLLETHKHWVKC